MPDFSVVIPARNEATYLPQTLRALEKQTYGPAEVIVVDNGSTDTTADIARAWGATVMDCPERGVAKARQAGLEAAKSPWIASTDADSLPVPEWLQLFNEATANNAALYGPMRFGGITPFWSTTSELAYSAFLHVCRVANKPNLAAANMAFSKEAGYLVGGYPNVEAYEDILFGQALSEVGPIRYVSGALVETSARRLDKGIVPFLLQHYRNTIGHRQGYFEDEHVPQSQWGRGSR